ncbi:MAG: hypothetical protein ACI35O_01385 [Bacillaceae bacterium]
MRNMIPSIIFSFVSLLIFIIFRGVFDLIVAFSLSLFISLIVYGAYIKKKNPTNREIIYVSLGTGLFFIIFSSIGIKLFPPTHIRDIGDLIMPYMNAFIFSFWLMVSYLAFGFLLSRLR